MIFFLCEVWPFIKLPTPFLSEKSNAIDCADSLLFDFLSIGCLELGFYYVAITPRVKIFVKFRHAQRNGNLFLFELNGISVYQ